ncbi:secreted protein [Streptomyces viridochromogenes DSM 40736]|uniref:Secreted protein n=1 Tax=Streptomyces viridochromogenes (strain DSM 40736 / JCM 4977 / BCRC 1201 / Tue 494) TaxID=591159 RepID=D9XAT8_STRVT|nr:chaplin [Streptomyces viridochromogenes]EFL32250.1 secreted protein [Streptomyces viridochromogenes DSM 40736]
MRQTLSKGAFAAAAATGILSLYGSPALADADASGVAKDSPGVLSGNTVQVPVDAPVNLCGNTVNVIAALNESFGNACRNNSYGSKGSGAQASGIAKGSPGVGSGNVVQAPVDVPLNVCGNSVDGLAVFNEAAKNDCENNSYGGGYGGGYGHDDETTKPGEERTPPVKEERPTPHDKEKPGSPTKPRGGERDAVHHAGGDRPAASAGRDRQWGTGGRLGRQRRPDGRRCDAVPPRPHQLVALAVTGCGRDPSGTRTPPRTGACHHPRQSQPVRGRTRYGPAGGASPAAPSPTAPWSRPQGSGPPGQHDPHPPSTTVRGVSPLAPRGGGHGSR